jgi:4-amino-4-deoxy-L-arabinose transferase-like glycosyltransferase
MAATDAGPGSVANPRGRRPAASPADLLPYVGLGLALLIGAFVRFWHLWSQSLFLDEAFTFDAAARPVHDLLVQILNHDAHPPAFYLVTHWLMSVFPHLTAQQFRSFTAPLGLVTIAAVWGIARRQFGEVAAFVAAVVVATEPSLVQLDRLYRMYAVLSALTAASWWLLVAIPDSAGARRRIYTIAYVVMAAALPSVQYLGGAVVLTQIAYAAWLFARSRSERPLFGLTLAGALAGALSLSWWVVWALPTQFHQGGYAGAGSVTQTWWEIPSGALGYGLPVEWYSSAWFAACFAGAGVIVVLAGAWLGRETILPWFLLPIALQAIFTALTGKDLILSRYLIHIVPAFAIACGALTAALLRTQWRVVGFVFALSIVSANGVALENELMDPVYQTPDWDQVAKVMTAEEAPRDRIVLDDGYPYLILRTTPAFAGRDISAPTEAEQVAPTIAWTDAKPSLRIWYVENQYYYPDPSRLVLAHLVKTRPRLHEWLEPRADLSNRVYFALFGPAKARHR